MRKLRALVVDDSAFNRRTISDLLAAMPDVEVVAKASDGDEALRLATQVAPDLITLDLEMPRMDGFTFLRLLMAKRPTPVIVVSGYSNKDNVFRALELGALDFIAKPARSVTADLVSIRDELASKVELVRHLSPSGLDPQTRTGLQRGRTMTSSFVILPAEARSTAVLPPRKVFVVAASTGGPTALLELFAKLPPNGGAAVVVAQHMPEKFTKTFAERLDRIGTVQVHEAAGTEVLHAGRAYICPGGSCIEVGLEGADLVARVVAPEPTDRYVPSGDRLFRSAARAAGDKTVAVVLTGMGDDGSQGVAEVKARGGSVLAESADTAVIFGMPGAAVRTGAVDKTLPLRQLAEHLGRLAL